MPGLDSLSPILSGIVLAGFAATALWLLLRPRARMAVLMPAPRLLAQAGLACSNNVGVGQSPRRRLRLTQREPLT